MSNTTIQQRIRGSIVAIVTPMTLKDEIDYPALAQLIEWHIEQGTDGIVIVGTSGESPTVSVEEHCELIRFAVQTVAGRIPVIAGSGGNSTIEAIKLTQFAQSVGADASLQVVPYYNRPTQEGMIQHFCTIARSTNLPIILYNVPGRTVADLSNDSIIQLAQEPNIIGVKDATGNLARGIDLIERAPKNFIVLSGDDASAMALMFCGARGNITVTGNITPALMHQMCAAAIAGDLAQARRINEIMLPLHQQLFVEPNPVPLKWVLAEMGKITHHLRLPLVPLSAPFHAGLRTALKLAQR